jgi:hypothetical protein
LGQNPETSNSEQGTLNTQREEWRTGLNVWTFEIAIGIEWRKKAEADWTDKKIDPDFDSDFDPDWGGRSTGSIE